MKIVCCYRKTITMNSVYDLEKLISNCSDSDSELSSLYERKTTFIMREACSNEPITVTIGKQIENQNAHNEEEQSCLNNCECCSTNERHDDLWPNQKAHTDLSETKDPLDEQPLNQLKESNELPTENQDNIQNDQDSLLADLNVGNLEKSLLSSVTENVSKIQGKILSKVSKDNTVVKMEVLKNELQKSRRKT